MEPSAHLKMKYLQRFRALDQNIQRIKNALLSSQKSCNQNSPQYSTISVTQTPYSQYSNVNWGLQNQTINSSLEPWSNNNTPGVMNIIEQSQINRIHNHTANCDNQVANILKVYNNNDNDNITTKSLEDAQFIKKTTNNMSWITNEVKNKLITNTADLQHMRQENDDYSHLDMEIETNISSETLIIDTPTKNMTSTPISKELNSCIEKSNLRKQLNILKTRPVEDIVDFHSFKDSILPILDINDLNYFIEQVKASEKTNAKDEQSPAVANGKRLQDADLQHRKTKKRHVLKPTTLNFNKQSSTSPKQTVKTPYKLKSIVLEDTEEFQLKKNVNKCKDGIFKPTLNNNMQNGHNNVLSHNTCKGHNPLNDIDKTKGAVKIKSASKATNNCDKVSNGTTKTTTKRKNMNKCKNNDRNKNKVDKYEDISEFGRSLMQHGYFYSKLYSFKDGILTPPVIKPRSRRRPFEDPVIQAALQKEELPPKKKTKLIKERY